MKTFHDVRILLKSVDGEVGPPEEVRGVTETVVAFKADTAGAEDLEEVERHQTGAGANDCYGNSWTNSNTERAGQLAKRVQKSSSHTDNPEA
jgi:hypothetical protein